MSGKEKRGRKVVRNLCGYSRREKVPDTFSILDVAKALEAAGDATEIAQASRLSRLLGPKALPIFVRLGRIAGIIGKVALPVGLTIELITRYYMEMKQLDALEAINTALPELEDQTSLIHRSLKDHDDLADADTTALRHESKNILRIAVVFLDKVEAMDGSGPSSLIIILATRKRIVRLGEQLQELDKDLAKKIKAHANNAKKTTITITNNTDLEIVIQTRSLFRGQVNSAAPAMLTPGDTSPGIELAGTKVITVYDARTPTKVLFQGVVPQDEGDTILGFDVNGAGKIKGFRKLK